MTRIAVIPAYEPEDRLVSLAREVKSRGFETIIVDDGSGEAFRDVFRAAAEYAEVISCPENRGKGAALKTAFGHISGVFQGEYTVVTLDADGQHRPEDAERLCDVSETEPEALILGSRRQTAASPLRSRVGNAVTRWVFRRVTGAEVYDTQTGLRAFSSRLLPLLSRIPGERYEYEMNVLMELCFEGVPIMEEPIETVYLNGNAGSHFHPIKDSVRIYKSIFSYARSRRKERRRKS